MQQARHRQAWLFLLPLLIVLTLVAAWPLARTIWFSFTDANINDLDMASWIGLENYFGEYGLFGNSQDVDGFWLGEWGTSIRNTLFFSVVSVLLETVFGLLVALMLNQEFKGRTWVRAAVLVPWAIPTIVSSRIWGWILHDQFGIVNHWLLEGGLINERIAFTASHEYSMWVVIMIDVWKTVPFMTLLILAALQTCPKDCYEAAKIDGVSSWRVFWSITMPWIKPALLVAVIFRMLDALRVFDLIYVLTSNNSSTISMSGYVQRQMVDNGYLGLGSAASTVLFLIISVLTILCMRLFRSKHDE